MRSQGAEIGWKIVPHAALTWTCPVPFLDLFEEAQDGFGHSSMLLAVGFLLVKLAWAWVKKFITSSSCTKPTDCSLFRHNKQSTRRRPWLTFPWAVFRTKGACAWHSYMRGNLQNQLALQDQVYSRYGGGVYT